MGQAADERSKKDDDLWSPALRSGGHMPSSASAPAARPLGSEAAFLSHFLPAPGNHPPPPPPWAAPGWSGLGLGSTTPRGDPATSRHRAAPAAPAHAPQQPGHHAPAGEWPPPAHSQAARSLGVPHPGAPAGYGGAHYGASVGTQAHASQPGSHAHAAHMQGLAGPPGQQHGLAHAHSGWSARQAAQGLAPPVRDWAGERGGSRAAAGCSPTAHAAASPRFLAAAAPHTAASQQRLTPRLSARAGPAAGVLRESSQATGSPAGPCAAEPAGRAHMPAPGAATAASAAAADGSPAAAAAAAAALGQRSPKRRRSQALDAPRACGAEGAAHVSGSMSGSVGAAQSPGPGQDCREPSEQSAFSQQHPCSSLGALIEAGSGLASLQQRGLWAPEYDVEAGRRPDEGSGSSAMDGGSRRVPTLRLPQPHVQPAEPSPGEPSVVCVLCVFVMQAV